MSGRVDQDGTSNHATIPHVHASTPGQRRRTKSLSLPADASLVKEPSAPPLRFIVDDAVHELLHGKGKVIRPRGGPLNLLSGLLACWQPRKGIENREDSLSSRAATLLEISQRQQCELADKQDTIDMLEWQLEQMQVLACKEYDLQPVRRSSASGHGLGIPEGESRKECDPNQQKLEEKMKLDESMRDNSLAIPGYLGQNNDTTEGRDADSLGSVLLFETAATRARFTIRSFCKVLIKQIEASGYSVLRTISEMEPNARFVRKQHVVYTLESRINKAFFNFFENDSFDESGVTQILDPSVRCKARLDEFQKLKLVDVDDAVDANHPSFDPDFRKFCEQKTRELWSQFYWNLVFKSTEERDMFTGAFLDAAKGVWLLHRLAFSMNPPVSIVRVRKGMEIDPVYVDAVPHLSADSVCPKCFKFKVEFLIMPGFRANKMLVIRCQVYQHVEC